AALVERWRSRFCWAEGPVDGCLPERGAQQKLRSPSTVVLLKEGAGDDHSTATVAELGLYRPGESRAALTPGRVCEPLRACGRSGDRGFAVELWFVLLRTPLFCPHTQNGFWVGKSTAFDFGPVFEFVQQSLPIEPQLPRLPVDTWHRRFIEYEQGRHAGA